MTTTPKIKYAGQREKQVKEERKPLDPGVQAVLMRTSDPRVRDLIEKVAKAYDLPEHGITVMGGNPYVNVTGLDERIQQKWLSQGWVKTETAKMIQHATKENNYLAGCEVTIEFFNYNSFNDGVQNLKEYMNPELLKELRKTYTTSFTSEGWASPTSCAAIAYDYVWSQEAGKKVPGELLVENVNMMAERKASNRAKRAAVGCGLTSIEEIIGKDSQVVDLAPEDVEVQKGNPEAITPEQIDELKKLALEIGYKKLDLDAYRRDAKLYHEDMVIFRRMKALVVDVKTLRVKREIPVGFLKKYGISNWNELHRVTPDHLTGMIDGLKELPLANEPEKIELKKLNKAEKIQLIKDKVKELNYKPNSPQVTEMLQPYDVFNLDQLVSLDGKTLDKILREEFCKE